MKVSTFLAVSVLAHPCSVSSFFVPSSTTHVSSSSSTTATQLYMAGFGGGGGKKGGKNKKSASPTLPKLKAKTQWDRYADLKQCKKVRVGVKLLSSDDENADWMEVGRVRSENDEYTLVAIARQRALIADHAKRLYPVKIPANSVLEWGYIAEEEEGEDNNKWVVVDKASGEDAPKGIEKKFGFEGFSDKASGFYCFYSEGRVVERGEALDASLTTGSKTLPN